MAQPFIMPPRFIDRLTEDGATIMLATAPLAQSSQNNPGPGTTRWPRGEMKTAFDIAGIDRNHEHWISNGSHPPPFTRRGTRLKWRERLRE